MNGFGVGFSRQAIKADGFKSGILLQECVVSRGIQLYLDSGRAGSYSGSGATWVDISGNGKNATLYNAPTYSSTNGGLLTFAKASFHYAETNADLGNMSTWTVENWIKLDSALVAGPNAIVTNQYDLVSKLNYCIGSMNALNNNAYAAFFDAGGWHLTTTGQALSLSTWYHLVGTYDGATVSFYVNGALIGTLSYAGTPQSGGKTRIARRWDDVANDANNFVGGSIPIVRIYNRAFTQSEVTQNFNESRGRFGI